LGERVVRNDEAAGSIPARSTDIKKGQMQNKSAFTLVEIIVVVVMLGLLAALVIPRITGKNEKIVASEGIKLLGELRSSQLRYNAEKGAYTTDIDLLDFSVGGSSRFQAPTPITDSATPINVGQIQRQGGYLLMINEAGTVFCTRQGGSIPCADAGCPGNDAGWVQCN
jgi:prepilin-type N-terminal cleavage/methylation domain-containing protein